MADLTLLQVQKIRRICPASCELCEEPCPPSSLEPCFRVDRLEEDPSRRFLLLCPLCRKHIARVPLTMELAQKRLDCRSYPFRRMLRRILGIAGSPYAPPPTEDLGTLYREACDTWSLNGAG